VVAVAELADDLGLDIIGLQDHPYQPQRRDETRTAVDHLRDALLAHLKYEEEQLLEPIGRPAIRIYPAPHLNRKLSQQKGVA
jgi:hypothetical protein